MTVTTSLTAAELQAPEDTITEYVPAVETVIDCVVSPVDQTLSTNEDEVKTTFPPEQKLKGPEAEIVGVTTPGSESETVKVLDVHEFASSSVRSYVPAAKFITFTGRITEIVPELVPVQDKKPNQFVKL